MARDGGPLPHRLSLLAGAAGALVGGVAIATAIQLAPWFTWTGHALSHLGRPGRASAPVFNGGLIVAGILGVVFALGLWNRRSNRVEGLGIAALALSFGCLSLIGVFPVGQWVHGPVSVAFLTGFTYALLLVGSGGVLAGNVRQGLRTIWLGILHVTVWAAWVTVGTEGVAIPEAIGAMMLAAWALLAARDGAVDR